ncbi:hypothetical protein BGZ67_001380 [Mortierella alpina]|nr:hypothetical protein BGZ67_001380 [Mortierella alpina]
MATDTAGRPQDHGDGSDTTTDQRTWDSNPLARPKARNILQNILGPSGNESSQASVLGPGPEQKQRASTQSQGADNGTATEVLSSATLFNKTWNIYKTTPFYSFNTSHLSIYERELIAHIAAHAKNLSTSALAAQTDATFATIVRDRVFPGQIDSSGQNFVETADIPGDIKSIEFQLLDLEDVAEGEHGINDKQDVDVKRHSILITITLRPKGKAKDQLYFCTALMDKVHDNRAQASVGFTHFSMVFLKTPAMLGQLVIQWLERKFDCRICRLSLQTYELRKVVNSSLEATYNHAQGREDKRPRPIELHYAFPQTIADLRSVSVSVSPEDARQLLVSRVEGATAGLLEGVEAHCSESMKVDFERLRLTRAGCSSWFIATEGKVKIFPDIADKHSLQEFIQAIARCGT